VPDGILSNMCLILGGSGETASETRPSWPIFT
jgi:hypothetical protein